MKTSTWIGALRGASLMVLIIVAGYIPTGSEGLAWRIVALIAAVIVLLALDVWAESVRARRSAGSES